MKTLKGGEAMAVKEMQVWKEKLEKACALLAKAWDFAYRYRVEFDTEVQGKRCKLAVYQEKDGKLYMALTQEAYEKATELSESEDKKIREAARGVLNHVRRFSESFEAWKVRKILQEARHQSTKIEGGKIKTRIEGVAYELEEEKVKELAQMGGEIHKDIQKYYKEVLKNVEKERKWELKNKLWEEIEKNWVRRVLAGSLLYLVGVGKGEGHGGFYYAVDMDILPKDLKEEVKKYAIFLKDTRGIQDIDSYTAPGLVRPTRLPAGWYVPEGKREVVEKILKESAERYADDKDREIVEEYIKLQKEVLK
jgi:hypothetical protein